MKKVLLIATGGTIACRETANGLSPTLTGGALVRLLPALETVCAVTVCELMRLDSTDLTAADRMQMARAVWENSEAGTTALSLPTARTRFPIPPRCCTMLRNIDRPVVLTGSMLPMGAPGSDAPATFDACRVAAADCVGVLAVLHGKIIHGPHAAKRHSLEADAFTSVGAPLAGVIDGAGCVRLAHPPKRDGTPRFVRDIDTGRSARQADARSPALVFQRPAQVSPGGGRGVRRGRHPPGWRTRCGRCSEVARASISSVSALRAAWTCTNTRSAGGPRPWASSRSAVGRPRTR